MSVASMSCRLGGSVPNRVARLMFRHLTVVFFLPVVDVECRAPCRF